MAKSKLVEANKKIETAVTGGYQHMEDRVVKGYEKIETAFVERYLTHENETAAEAKQRLQQKKAEQRLAKERNRT